MVTIVPPGPRLARHLRLEDVALVVWLVVAPLVLPAVHAAPLATGSDPLGGILDLVALSAAAACLVARRADATHSGLFAQGDVAYAVGPVFGAVAFALDDGVQRLGPGAAGLMLVVPVVAAAGARLWLAPTTSAVRRALVTPFLLVTSGFFSGFLSGLTDLFDLRALAAALGGPDAALSLLVLGFGLAGVLVFYVMLVFAPRQIAEREGGTATWLVRFLVFVAGLAIAATVHGLGARA